MDYTIQFRSSQTDCVLAMKLCGIGVLGVDRYSLLLLGIPEIKTSNKTKEEIAEGGPLRVPTPLSACEPVPEVETDEPNSGANS